MSPTGLIEWFDEEQGFGVIRGEDGIEYYLPALSLPVLLRHRNVKGVAVTFDTRERSAEYRLEFEAVNLKLAPATAKRSLEKKTAKPGDWIETRVVGVSYEGRQEVIKQLRVGETLCLIHDSLNKHDPNAVKVTRLDGSQIGYLAKDIAARTAPWLDVCGGTASAEVVKVIGGEKTSKGVVIRYCLS